MDCLACCGKTSVVFKARVFAARFLIIKENESENVICARAKFLKNQIEAAPQGGSATPNGCCCVWRQFIVGLQGSVLRPSLMWRFIL
jgi:hypothetical protein